MSSSDWTGVVVVSREAALEIQKGASKTSSKASRELRITLQ